jgi:hypothetical protein
MYGCIERFFAPVPVSHAHGFIKCSVVFSSLIVIPACSTLVDSYDVRISRAIKNEKTAGTFTSIASPLSIDL